MNDIEKMIKFPKDKAGTLRTSGNLAKMKTFKEQQMQKKKTIYSLTLWNDIYNPDMLHVSMIVAELFSGIALFPQISIPFDLFAL